MERRKGRGEEGWKERRELGEEERRKGGGRGGLEGRGELGEEERRTGGGEGRAVYPALFRLPSHSVKERASLRGKACLAH